MISDTVGGDGPRLFCFGLGYSAQVLARRLAARGWAVTGTHRENPSAAAPFATVPFDDPPPLNGVTHLLSSVPPDGSGDPVLECHVKAIAAARDLAWIGYLSSTGVYGDTGGALVDEDAPLAPTSERGRRRVAAEAGWRALGRESGIPVQIFRLAGIYGPGRSPLDRVRAGNRVGVDKPGHMFSRIHVDDIATLLEASMARPRAGAIYNVCDDEPAAAADVVTFACALLNIAPPPPVAFAEAARSMSDTALSFWRDNRRVDNRRIKTELGVRLAFPDYRSGLRAILAAES